MCLILFSHRATPGYRLILAANRDEFYARKTAPLQRWGREGRIISGRDLQAGGTWLGATVTGRFGGLTNYREVQETEADRRSRGEILIRYLDSDMSAAAFVEHLHRESDRYRGFNLVVGDHHSLYYCSNRAGAPQRLGAGVHALSNHLLDTSWPKVERGKCLFRKLLYRKMVATEDVFAMLADRRQPPLHELPQTGIGLEWEKILAPIFIRSEGYGTRSSAVLTIDDDGQCRFHERTYATEAAGNFSEAGYTFATGCSGRQNEDIQYNNSEDPRRRSSARE